MLTNIALIILSILYPVTFIYFTHQHKQERSELLDRIMAKNFSEYESYKQLPSEKKKLTEPTNFLQKSILNAYRSHRGPFDDEPALKAVEREEY